MFYKKIPFSFFYFKISHLIQWATCHFLVIVYEIYYDFWVKTVSTSFSSPSVLALFQNLVSYFIK